MLIHFFFRFEEDPNQVVYSLVCQDDGFFDAPDNEDDWPRCVLGPTCEEPPDIPYEASRLIIPKTIENEAKVACVKEGSSLQLKCPTFQSLYIQAVRYGRKAM